MARVAANELAPSNVRVNAIFPGTVDTPALGAMLELMDPSEHEGLTKNLTGNHLFPVMLESRDISQAVLFLASDDSRYITGLEMAVDAGTNAKASSSS
jgi:NAD(P)-dependent dehydrogenase (short-subunit alcohol dehydrogenase family)